jgi:hypothetical protein
MISPSLRFPNDFIAVAIMAMCLLLPGGAHAADLGTYKPAVEEPLPPAPRAWEFSFTPYAWAMGVNGDVTVRGNTAHVDASFIDIVEDSDSLLALMGSFEARRGRLGLFTDAFWVDLGFSGSVQRSANPIANLNILASARADFDYELTVVQSGVAFELAQWSGATSTTAFDLLASARYWNNSADLSVDVNATVNLGTIGFERSGSRAVARSGTLDWVDPVVGARIRHRTASGSTLTLIGDVGGFGAASDFSWQAVATYGWDTMLFNTPFHALIGYRALAVDYSESGPFGQNGIDAVLHGPVMGAKFTW